MQVWLDGERETLVLHLPERHVVDQIQVVGPVRAENFSVEAVKLLNDLAARALCHRRERTRPRGGQRRGHVQPSCSSRSITNPVSASAGRESNVQVGESSLTPGSIQISPRELTRSQGELARSSLENADAVTERRRIVGKRTIISPAPLALSDNVDSASVPDSLHEAGLPEVLEPSEVDTKKRQVESFDQSVDWFQREGSSIAWMTNVSDEREIFEIDVGDPLESERSFCRDSSVWLSKRLSDGKSSEVTYHRLLTGQQLQFDEAMTKELSQVLAADAIRRLSQEEELNLKPERLLRMRWVLTWKYTEGGDRRGWSFWCISIQS